MRKLQANSFEVGWPEGWDDRSQIIMVGPLRPTFGPNLQVNQEAAQTGKTAQQYFAEQREELHQLEGFRLVEVGDRLLGGQRAEYHSYIWKIPQGVEIQQLQLITQRGNTLYTVTCSCMASDWHVFEGAFEMMLAGFRFT